MTQTSDAAACSAHGRPVLVALALAALVLLAFFFRLGDDVALDSHESLLAVTARNMVENRPVALSDGSRPSPWLVPNFNDQIRILKPPLPYWFAADLGHYTGGVGPWTARLPSAVAAVGTLLVLLMLMRREGPQAAGLWAVAAMATSALFLTLARHALAEMPLTFFVTASLASAWMAGASSSLRRTAWLALCGTAAGLAAMCKGPVILQFLPLPLLSLAFVPRAWASADAAPESAPGRHWLWTASGVVLAVLIFVAICLPWPLYIVTHVPDALAIWKAQSVDRAAGDFGHQEPWYYYLLRLPLLTLPWAAFGIYGIHAAVRRWNRNTPECRLGLFFGAWLVGGMISLSLASGKQNHYLLPLMPAVGFFSGLGMAHLARPEDDRARRFAQRFILAHAILFALLAVGGAVYVLLAMKEVAAPVALTSALLLAAAIPGTFLALRSRLGLSLAALVGGILLAVLAAWSTFIGPLEAGTAKARFAAEVRRLVPPGAPLYGYNDTDSQVIYYSGRAMTLLPGGPAVDKLIAHGQPFYLVCIAGHGEPEPAAQFERLHSEPNSRQTEKSLVLLRWPKSNLP